MEGSSNLEKTLQELPNLLREREAALDQREREVKRLRTSLERDHPQVGQPGDVLRLNVGGQRVDVLRRTLTQVEGSLLASKFSGRWSLEADADGCVFWDQPAALVLPLVNYLRARQIETPLAKKAAPPPFHTPKETDDFQRLVEYYGVTLAVYPVGLYRLETRRATWRLVGQGECRLDSSDWATYALKPYGDIHSRNVESYEVTLRECSSVQIGWISLYNLPKYCQSENGRGVGYGSTSVALDCVQSGIVEAGNVLALPASVDFRGTTIRSEKWGSDWYVNGVLVASTSSEENGVLRLGCPYLDTVPCLSIKGTCQISKIELTF